MCGITGWINLYDDLSGKKEIVQKMTDTLKFRGPDDTGFYISEHALLGHRRLVVVDPKGGAQPMTKKTSRYSYTIVYNGELYNTEDLRKELLKKGYSFQSYSDTEVLLTSYMEWGPQCVKKLNGIFAFGVWDEERKSLFLARDPLGVKPLFFTLTDNSIIFGSEIKTLLAHPQVDPILDRQGLLEIFGLGPGRSLGCGIFKGIKEVKPGFSLLYSIDGIKEEQYWRLKCVPHTEDIKTTIEHLRSLLLDAIKRQLVADVPVCTFLSGGLDSSAISAVAASTFNEENIQLNTYSIDYRENDLYFKPNEFEPNSDREYARRMSKFIGSNHHEITIGEEELAKALMNAVDATDLPGMADIDSSLYLFCKEIRKNATVALSGECADEVFGGYPWYRREEDLHADTFPWSKFVGERSKLLSKELKGLPLEEYVQSKYKESLNEVPHIDGESWLDGRIRELFYLNIKWFMMTLLNRKDRMSMSNSLEVRVPFADYRLVEYAFNVPASMKFYGNREKGLLRESLRGILPDDVIERKKSPYPKTHHPGYLSIVQREMNSILQDKNSPILQIIDINTVTEIVNTGGKSFGKPWYGQLMRGPQMIAFLIQVNYWLKKYNVNII